MNSYTVGTVVCGYHVYREIWEAAVGQVLPCQRERGNVHDPTGGFTIIFASASRCNRRSIELGSILASRCVASPCYYPLTTSDASRHYFPSA